MKKIIYSLIIISNLSYTMNSENDPNNTDQPASAAQLPHEEIFIADWLDLDGYGSDFDADDWLSHNQMPGGTGNTGGAAAANSETDNEDEKPPAHDDQLLKLKKRYQIQNAWFKAYRKDGKLILKPHSSTDDTNLPY